MQQGGDSFPFSCFPDCFFLCFRLPIETATRRVFLQMVEQISLTAETDSLYGGTFLELVELK